MKRNVILFELKELVRDRWMIFLAATILVILIFALQNGMNASDQIAREIEEEQTIMDEKQQTMLGELDSISRGLMEKPSVWRNPQSPAVVGNRYPKLAAKQPSDFAFLAVGQSDLYSHMVKPTFTDESYALDFSELSNPVQLLFGHFDLSFVIIYLLPLIVIGFSYNLLSREKESGRLLLIASQPVSLLKWLGLKMGLRFVLIGGWILVAMLIAITWVASSLEDAFSVISLLAIPVLLYLAFWFLMALWINLYGRSSGTNAVNLVMLWVILVLLVPTVLNQSISVLYPLPSRVVMINEMRAQKAEADKKADSILNDYLRDHPELAQSGEQSDNPYQYWLKYIASQDKVREAVKPVVDEFEIQLENQQKAAAIFTYLSPAMLMQHSMNHLAGNSAAHFESYRLEVKAFADSWKAALQPPLFKGEIMDAKAVNSLPEFSYAATHVKNPLLLNNLFLLLYGLLIYGLAYVAYHKIASDKMIQTS